MNQRWTKISSTTATHPVATTSRADVPQCIVTLTIRKKFLGHNEKFLNASITLQAIASELAQCDMAFFEQRLAQLELAKACIEKGKDFTVLACDLDGLSQNNDLAKLDDQSQPDDLSQDDDLPQLDDLSQPDDLSQDDDLP